MKLYLGDCLKILKTLKPNSIDSVVTDPPYGWRFMGKAWDGEDIEKDYQRDLERKQKKAEEKGEWRTGSDGRRRRRATGLPGGIAAEGGNYDRSITGNQAFQNFSNDWAKEALRILKPGGYIIVFCGPRTYHRMASGVEDAGFEIRDQLQWLFGSGFPKSLDIGKAIDKAAGETDLAKQWDGWGTALKPANEPILLARKPLSEKTVAKNILKWGTGGLNIDVCRIGLMTQKEIERSGKSTSGMFAVGGVDWKRGGKTAQGRFPANLILDETAAEMLDGQTGKLDVSKRINPTTQGNSKFHNNAGYGEWGYADSGGASRFFYCAKASKSERNAGLRGMPQTKVCHHVTGSGKRSMKNGFPETLHQNFHPTVKPIRLMEYLIRLVTPLGGTVLDPFLGSGTTGVAAKRLGFDFCGIEREAPYMKIARARVKNA